ncbi:alkaline phosphatase family protein [Roseicyclus sp. F158]|uniref:Alkaline phosphatase family protein n=1 Tax=Tropicimonas omnivorans TaxID=3075590 RepID=A0ABU3DLM7_9RHOB|nr:alkaline phosphatase family protein [Roseicyclus sp. F158]MDT0684478.1 alkaline phosphatase family protein [Roseicyclus sp. F158]
MTPRSCLIATFDGLRRDRATADLMPNVARFLAGGTDCVNARSVFPSETRVAVTSTITGCAPAAHGLVANQFLHPVAPDRIFQTASNADLSAAAAAGQLIDRRSLGERLAEAGRSMAIVSTASPGATRMMSPRAHALGHPVFSVHGAPVGTEELQRKAEDRLGTIPPAGTPNSARVDHAVDVLTRIVYPDHDPDLAILWLSDPDITSHGFGVTSSETEAAQAACDAAFGRLLEWWEAGNGPENIVVMSDHGQITGSARVDPVADFPDWEGRLVPGALCGLWLEETGPDAIQDAVDRLRDTRWAGLIFASGAEGQRVNGAMPWSAVNQGHPRTPTIGVTLRAAPAGPDGVEQTFFAAGIEPGGGIHGGLTRGELSTVLGARGPAFRQGHRSEVPCWLPDIAPTILSVMGLPVTGTTGRAMIETLAAGGRAPDVERHVETVEHRGHAQHLAWWQVGDGRIVDCGWMEEAGASSGRSKRAEEIA